jgi:hypothetical protein
MKNFISSASNTIECILIKKIDDDSKHKNDLVPIPLTVPKGFFHSSGFDSDSTKLKKIRSGSIFVFTFHETAII